MKLDSNKSLQAELAEKSRILDELLNSDSKSTKVELARNNFGLSTLITDRSWEVRAEVSKQGCGLDILAKDESEKVRKEVRRQEDVESWFLNQFILQEKGRSTRCILKNFQEKNNLNV